MRIRMSSLAVAALAATALLALPDRPLAAQEPSGGLASLAFSHGEWEGSKLLEDGRTYRVRMTSSWWLEGRSVVGESFDAHDDEPWTPFYKGFQAWHGELRRIVFNSVGRDGEFVSGHIEVEPGSRVLWYWTVVGAGGATREGRDTWDFEEDGQAFLWTFATEARDGSYTPYFEIRMERVG